MHTSITLSGVSAIPAQNRIGKDAPETVILLEILFADAKIDSVSDDPCFFIFIDLLP